MNAATLFDNSQNVSGGVSAPAPSGLYVAPVWSAYTGSTGGQTSAFGTATTGPLNVSAPSGIMTPATPEQIAAASAARTDFDTDVLPDPAAAYYAAAPWTLDAVSPSDSSLSDESGSDEYLAVATTEQAHGHQQSADDYGLSRAEVFIGYISADKRGKVHKPLIPAVKFASLFGGKQKLLGHDYWQLSRLARWHVLKFALLEVFREHVEAEKVVHRNIEKALNLTGMEVL